MFGSPSGNATCTTSIPKGGLITLLQIQSSTTESDGTSDENMGCLTYFSAFINNSPCTSGNISDSGAMLTMQNDTEDYSVSITGVFSNATCVYGLEFCVTNLVHFKLGSGDNEVAHTNGGKSVLGPDAHVRLSWDSEDWGLYSIIWGIEITYNDTNSTVYGIMDPPAVQYADFMVEDPLAICISQIQLVYSNSTPHFTQIASMSGMFGGALTSAGVWNYGAATLTTNGFDMALVGIYTVDGEKLLDSLEFSNAV